MGEHALHCWDHHLGCHISCPSLHRWYDPVGLPTAQHRALVLGTVTLIALGAVRAVHPDQVVGTARDRVRDHVLSTLMCDGCLLLRGVHVRKAEDQEREEDC